MPRPATACRHRDDARHPAHRSRHPPTPTAAARRRPRPRRRLRPRPARACSAIDRRRRRVVPAGPAVERRRRRSPPAPASTRATTRPRAGCSPISSSGARHGRPTASARCSPATSPSRSRKRLAMFVLRSKVTLADVSAGIARFGVGGPARPTPCARRSARRAAGRSASRDAADATIARRCPGRASSSLAPADAAPRSCARARARTAHAGRRSTPGAGSTIRAGVPVITAATQDRFVAAGRQLGRAGRRQLPEGLLHRAGDRRAHAIPRPAQGAAVRVPRADRPTSRPATRLFSAAFGDQPCGTVVNAAPAPGGGSDLLAVLQLAARPSRRRPPRRARRPAARAAAAALRDAAAGGAARAQRAAACAA